MLPVQIYNYMLLYEEEKKRQRRAINLERRIIRNDSDPFALSDNTFRDLFRLTKDMVNEICVRIVPLMQRSSDLAVDPIIRIFAALYFFATGSYQRTVGQSHNLYLSQSVVSKCILEICNLIEENLAAEWIKFPMAMDEINRNKTRFMEKTRFPGVLGAVDCTHVAIIAPNIEEHNYVNRKGFHSKNVQIICDFDLRIFNINARFPGCSHDSFIWRNSNIREELQRRYNAGDRNTWLLGDSGYPQEPWLMTPILNAQDGSPEQTYNERHAATRNCVERCNGTLKGRFRCIMRERNLRYKPEVVTKIINCCAVLHNMCVAGRMLRDIDLPRPVEENYNIQVEEHGRVNNEGVIARMHLIRNYFN